MPKVETFAVIGVGRAGGALSLALSRVGAVINLFVARERRTAERIAVLLPTEPRIASRAEFVDIRQDVVIIATRDDEIAATAAWLSEQLGEHRPHVCHLSGAVSSEVLSPLRELGCSVASFHPLVSLSDAERGAALLPGAFFGIEGDPEAVETCLGLARRLGGTPLILTAESKSLYHAAAVNACGHMVGLIDVSLAMLAACGIDPDIGRAALLPLIESTVSNLRNQSPATALTGPFARGDAATVARHLERIAAELPPEVLTIYCELGLRSLSLAAENGVDESRIGPVRDNILLAKRKPRC